MNALMQALAEPWTHAYFVKAALGGSLVAIACATLGCFVILRRMAFIGDAMSHALLPGVGIGYLVMKAFVPGGFTAGGLLLGALIAALLTSVCIAFLGALRRISEDTAIGIIYTGLFAAGVVILTRFQQLIDIDLNHFFQGDVYGIAWSDLWLGAGVGALVVGALIVFFRYFTLVSFDPILAASIGVPTRLVHIALTGMIALVCVAGISMVGVIMIVGLLVTPPALAYLFTDRLPRMMALAAVFGVLSVLGGLYFSEWINASGGGAIMFVGFLLFLFGLVVAPRYGLLAGWLRRRRTVPQSDLEDLLKAAYEQTEAPLLPARRRRAIRRLAAEGFVEPAAARAGRVELTAKGRDEAAHVMRSHQLWEGHFIREGMPEPEAHRAAERLEHLHDRTVLDAFDDELEHPAVDAHGMPVPGEREDEPGMPRLTLSLMREGDRVRLVDADGPWPVGLSAGLAIAIAPREASGAWRITDTQGRAYALTHEEADRLIVERS